MLARGWQVTQRLSLSNITKYNGLGGLHNNHLFSHSEGWKSQIKMWQGWDFPGGPVVKNPLCNAEDSGSILGEGTKFSHSIEKLSLHAVTTEPMHSGAHKLQLEKLECCNKDAMQPNE